MKKNNQSNAIIFIIYIFLLIGIYLWLMYPVLIKPVELVPSNVPTLSVNELNQAEKLFNSQGKNWPEGIPEEPEISGYIFGQREPF